MMAAMQKIPILRDVSTDQQSTAASETLTIDRDAASRFGISPTDIDAAIYNQIGQHEVAQYFTQLNSYHVVMEAPPALQATPELFNSIFLASPLTGKRIPLSLLVKVDGSKTRPLSISHQGQLPAATLSFNLPPGVPLGDATKLVEEAKADLGAPATLTGSFQGTAQAFQQSLSTMPILIMAALLSVYVILGVLYESYIHPLTILSTLPSAGLGALLALRAGQPGPERDRHHRHPAPDRHRQEERHYGGRRGAEAGAGAGAGAGGGRGRRPPISRLRPILMTTRLRLPGRACRWSSIRAMHRLGVPPAGAGLGHRRRADRVSRP